ncbi:hypothetical protein CK498_22345 [Halomonas salipaludis]|uniref:Uncharacterized protein n=1 Tax=Halomonas salipaludis TaxID=2032625 RepID=A0A2A2EQB1_9GAMM|nr:hypothetical protein CK498_22345 [Halomonas salipaludis]
MSITLLRRGGQSRYETFQPAAHAEGLRLSWPTTFSTSESWRPLAISQALTSGTFRQRTRRKGGRGVGGAPLAADAPVLQVGRPSTAVAMAK